MLHSENRKNRKESLHSLSLCLLIILAGCGGDHKSAEKNTKEAFSDLKTPSFAFYYDVYAKELQRLRAADSDTVVSDAWTRKHYKADGSTLWLDGDGLKPGADGVLEAIRRCGEKGLDEEAFGLRQLEADARMMKGVKDMAADSSRTDSISRVAARLEYSLTKAFMRYCAGQRYGFMDARRVLNRLEEDRHDTLKKEKTYKQLFALKTKRPDDDFYRKAAGSIAEGKVAEFIGSCEPQGAYYRQLLEMLKTAGNGKRRRKILANIEKCRWRIFTPGATDSLHVVVNIPSFELYAAGRNAADTLSMKMVCGNMKGKTPLLDSRLRRIDFNPVWNIPQSIVRNEVAPHAGDTAYFKRNRYYIVERESGKTIATEKVGEEMLKSGKYRVVQESGEGNSLGRMVFRFDNDFAVFLHDTPNRAAFRQARRSASHGCVRIEKPYELTMLLLGTDDEWLTDRIRISTGMEPLTERGKKLVEESEEEELRLIKSAKVDPEIPLHITYFTIMPHDGSMKELPDVYGYDEIIGTRIKHLVK